MKEKNDIEDENRYSALMCHKRSLIECQFAL